MTGASVALDEVLRSRDMANKLPDGSWRNRKHGRRYTSKRAAVAAAERRADAESERSAKQRILDSHSDESIADLAGNPSPNLSLPGVPAK